MRGLVGFDDVVLEVGEPVRRGLEDLCAVWLLVHFGVRDGAQEGYFVLAKIEKNKFTIREKKKNKK